VARIRIAQEAHRESGTDSTQSFTVIRVRRPYFYTLLGDVNVRQMNVYSAEHQLPISIWEAPESWIAFSILSHSYSGLGLGQPSASWGKFKRKFPLATCIFVSPTGRQMISVDLGLWRVGGPIVRIRLQVICNIHPDFSMLTLYTVLNRVNPIG